MVAMMAVSCAHKHGGGCHDSEKKECCHKSAEEKQHDCPNCEGKKAHGHDHSKMETPAPTMSDKVTQKISQEEFAQLYTKNKEKLGKSCTNPAMAYCGKTTKDMMVSENEASCLWTKVFRATRESLPELDGSACAKMIKGFAKK